MATLQITFGERVREYRMAKKLTQSGLAKLVGVRQSTVSDIETGRHAPTLETVEKFAEALSVQAQALLS